MVVLIDTNVIIDFLMNREPFSRFSEKVIRKCAEKEVTGYLAFHSVSNLWYILRKVPEEIRRKWLIDLCSFLQVTGVSHEEVIKAIANKNFKDFEDCLQDRCAESVRAQYIITRNTEDFAVSAIPAVLPEDFLNMIENQISDISCVEQ